MEVGDKVTFSFGKDEKEGTILKIFPKTVYITVDFPKHSRKFVNLPISQLQTNVAKKKRPAKKSRGKAKAKEQPAP